MEITLGIDQQDPRSTRLGLAQGRLSTLLGMTRRIIPGSARASRAVRGAFAANSLASVRGLSVWRELFFARVARRGAGRCTRGRVRSPEIPRYALFALLVLLSSRCFAAEVIPQKPDRYFNDYAGVVSRGVAERLNTQLAQFERESSNQVVVAIYRKMESDSSIEDYTQRIAQKWQVGQKDKRNGVVLFVFVDDRKMFIQVGYGLEGALPDVTAFDITERNIKPHFRTGDYEGGLTLAVDLICKAIRGEYKGTGRTHAERGSDNSGTVGLLVFLVVLVIFLLAVRASRRLGGYRYTGGGGPFVSGNWGSGGWSSGSSGGGFGSFSSGGGSFGGGGAGSSW